MADALSLDNILSMLFGGTDRKDTSTAFTGGGFVNTVVDSGDYSRKLGDLEYEYADLNVDSHNTSKLLYSPVLNYTNNTTLNVSDSLVSGSANSSVETPASLSMPQTNTQTPQLSQTQALTDSNGTDLPGLIIPIAIIGGAAVLGYGAIKAISDGGKK